MARTRPPHLEQALRPAQLRDRSAYTAVSRRDVAGESLGGTPQMSSSTEAATAKPPQNGAANVTASPTAVANNKPDNDGFNLTHKQIVTILIGLMSGMFLAALDQMIVGTSIIKIANDLNGFNLQAWITTAYLITSTIATPIYGKLSDIYGRKPLYLTAITIFLVGSVASAFATSMYELAAFRALQGL